MSVQTHDIPIPREKSELARGNSEKGSRHCELVERGPAERALMYSYAWVCYGRTRPQPRIPTMTHEFTSLLQYIFVNFFINMCIPVDWKIYIFKKSIPIC